MCSLFTYSFAIHFFTFFLFLSKTKLSSFQLFSRKEIKFYSSKRCKRKWKYSRMIFIKRELSIFYSWFVEKKKKKILKIFWYDRLIYIPSYIMLYYIISYYIMLYYVELYSTILSYITLFYLTLYHIMLYYTVLYYIVLYYIISYYITLYHIISSYIILYHILLYYVTLYHIISYHVTLYYIILYHYIIYVY